MNSYSKVLSTRREIFNYFPTKEIALNIVFLENSTETTQRKVLVISALSPQKD
jgi:hypothetical protein